MSVRIYSEGNYFFLEDPDASTPLSDHRSEVKIWFNNDNKYQIESKLIGSHQYVLADLVDINSVAYSQSGWDTFYRANTGFNTVSGGSGTAKGWKEAVEYYANLPLTLITPIIGDIYLVEKPTKIGIGILSYTTRQSGLWIKDANTGSLSDWRKLNVKVKFLDNEFAVVSVADETKQMKLDSSEISASTVRTLKSPDKDGTIALLSDFGTVSLTADPFPIFDTAVALSDLNCNYCFIRRYASRKCSFFIKRSFSFGDKLCNEWQHDLQNWSTFSSSRMHDGRANAYNKRSRFSEYNYIIKTNWYRL